VEDNNGQKDSTTKNIAVWQVPQVDFTYDNNNSLTVDFTGTASDGGEFFWWFGDGDTSVTQNPTHTYTWGMVYEVCFSTYNLQGCEGKTCKMVDLTGVGISKEQLSMVSIFPNPADKLLTINGPLTSGTKITITDMTGRTIHKEDVITGKTGKRTIDTSTFENGTYFILMENSWESSAMKLVIHH
jgi:hypothetical protein